MDEIRRRTNPEANINDCCVMCGRLKELNDLSIVTEQELLRARHLLRRPNCYKHVPVSFPVQNGTFEVGRARSRCGRVYGDE